MRDSEIIRRVEALEKRVKALERKSNQAASRKKATTKPKGGK